MSWDFTNLDFYDIKDNRELSAPYFLFCFNIYFCVITVLSLLMLFPFLH